MFPFTEVTVEHSARRRTFSGSVVPEELVWHRDAEDRTVKVITSEGWYLQLDDELPREMKSGDTYFIPRGVWHRVIRKGDGDLVVEIVSTP
jgi:quercetin dioxygenase-like cupin family protein